MESTIRKEALEWWKNKPLHQKVGLADYYFKLLPSLLNGGEVEHIYRKEVLNKQNTQL